MANIKNMKTYKAFYNDLFAARSKLSDRREEAREAGNNALAEELLQKYLTLGEQVREMRRAEIIELTSEAPNPSDQPVMRLRRIVQKGRQSLEALEELSTALGAAADLLNLATRVLRLL